MRTHELQERLKSLGFDPGVIDGKYGADTETAVFAALDKFFPAEPAPTPSSVIPADWLPNANMKRIITHWTAGAHKASPLDREHYHILIEADGKLIRGTHSIKDNDDTGDNKYAAHTRGINTGSIGVSLCCMMGARESPFDPGEAPMTLTQWNRLSSVVAELCRRYRIDVDPKTVLSHAEVQGTLGITQAGKWDFTRLAFDPSIKGAKACGDRLRSEVEAKL